MLNFLILKENQILHLGTTVPYSLLSLAALLEKISKLAVPTFLFPIDCSAHCDLSSMSTAPTALLQLFWHVSDNTEAALPFRSYLPALVFMPQILPQLPLTISSISLPAFF